MSAEKLDYIIASETQKAILYPDKDHWKTEYLAEAAAELASLRHDMAQFCGDNDQLIKAAGAESTRQALENIAQLRAEIETWKTAERLALETVAKLRAELDLWEKV